MADKKINRDTLFIDILKNHPRVVKAVIKAYRLPCLECKGLAQETIENVALYNGLKVEELVETIKAEIGVEN